MAEKPILFSGPLVRAILEGRKTQTRRVLTAKQMRGYTMDERDDGSRWPYRLDWSPGDPEGSEWRPSPYGEPGDTLWVRETFQVADAYEAELRYAADIAVVRHITSPDAWWRGKAADTRWRPSIHMPRWACRLTLRVTGVRVERVQDISTEDIIAEGLVSYLRDHDACVDLRQQWIALWDKINGPRGFGWDANPWVWVVEFEREEASRG